MKVIISGGGTGGHIFPAISIANAIKQHYTNADILFVGAEDRMEMTRIPEAGYKIIGLPVAGFDRDSIFKNIPVLIKLYKSLHLAKKIIKDFKPDIVIGVGGYASGPLLKIATSKKIPTIIQEQNSYAGVTNKLLAQKVSKVCVAYEDMESFFPKEKIVLTGNPIRQDLVSETSKEEAYNFFKLDPTKKTILVIGGSLGAVSINRSIIKNIHLLDGQDVQILWQCGERYHAELCIQFSEIIDAENVHVHDFIDRMDLAYKVADLVISRAGASTISELSALGKPAVLVPSPNVAEDHQTKNAMALVKKDAAFMVKDEDAMSTLLKSALEIVKDDNKLYVMSESIKQMARLDAASLIVKEVENLTNIKSQIAVLKTSHPSKKRDAVKPTTFFENKNNNLIDKTPTSDENVIEEEIISSIDEIPTPNEDVIEEKIITSIDETSTPNEEIIEEEIITSIDETPTPNEEVIEEEIISSIDETPTPNEEVIEEEIISSIDETPTPNEEAIEEEIITSIDETSTPNEEAIEEEIITSTDETPTPNEDAIEEEIITLIDETPTPNEDVIEEEIITSTDEIPTSGEDIIKNKNYFINKISTSNRYISKISSDTKVEEQNDTIKEEESEIKNSIRENSRINKVAESENREETNTSRRKKDRKYI